MSRSRGLLLLLSLALSGCSHLSYYSQAIGGHLEVMQASRPISEVVEAPECDPKLKEQLAEVLRIRDFASRELGLPENDSYRSYADLQRPFVTWNVFAAPEFSLKPETWCMPVVGCVGYRGFYKQADAEAFAAELKQRGLDTYVGGVPAYSTLGYFRDPVLNTFLKAGDLEVARIIFHELAHQLVFVEGDTAFNESFATLVENEGLKRWLARKASPELGNAVVERLQHKASFVELVNSYKARLNEIYGSDLPDTSKRAAKAEAMQEIARAYLSRQQTLGRSPVYKKWLDENLNNAKIASLALYTQLYPAFEALLREEGNDLPRFYERVRALAAMPHPERSAALKQLPRSTGQERRLAKQVQD